MWRISFKVEAYHLSTMKALALVIIFIVKFLKAEDSCFEENTLFVENSLPYDVTIEQCAQSCRSVEECKVTNFI